MEHIARLVVKFKYVVLIVAVALTIPCGIAYLNTRVNYDILSYIPEYTETMQGQEIMHDEFGVGAFAMEVVRGMPDKEVVALKEKIEAVDHVKDVLWYDDFLDLSVPKEMLPDDILKAFEDMDTDTTMMFILMEEQTSSDESMEACIEIRRLSGEQALFAGMTGMVEDLKELTLQETPVYVAVAVVLALITLSLTMDSFLIPVLFMIGIGFAVIYNMGTNRIFGEISFITSAIAAVLQLGVTMDYSIFLWHSYLEQMEAKNGDKDEAMVEAICMTFSSIVGSSTTTIAGFIALCFMDFRIGFDLGLVMAKGVILGVIVCVTVLPAMVLTFTKALLRTKHRPLLPDMVRLPKFICRHYVIFAVLFLILALPALYGNNHNQVYYNLTDTLPDTLPSRQANAVLEESFENNQQIMALYDVSMASADADKMIHELRAIDGVGSVLSADSVLGPAFPTDFLAGTDNAPQSDDDVTSMLASDHYKMMIITSSYNVASDEMNEQIERINDTIKHYDAAAMVVGEAPLTKDLIQITDRDFQTVNFTSIGIVFVIILLVFKSISLPALLVALIEFAIFVNMAVPYYMGTQLPFVASIVIGTIQLGATVDYAILMTTRYCRERNAGHDKREATLLALTASMKSVIISALSFFSATFGVVFVSKIDIIRSLCMMMARGALISMLVVLTLLPAVYMIFDGLIIRTTRGMKQARGKVLQEAIS